MEELTTWATASFTTYLLIFAAELGDKTQLVCMILAARYRAVPVILGATVAFALLNLLAVIFGMAIASWLPEAWLTLAVAVLFAIFGIQALRLEDGEEQGSIHEKSGHNVFLSTFLLMTVAELGDKTQIAVVALSTTLPPISVWFGATLALATTSALGVWAGRTLLQKISLSLLHRIGGILFLLLAAYAGYSAYLAFQTTP
ncbi:MAG TPA: TMEM165/GDT1 family protein [Mariprofundaceae bacterium]|nr:TMEM165/GDT1 family protein [Mariprofundaceae bacterium]